MIAEIKYKSYTRKNLASDHEQVVKTKEVECDEIDIEGNTIHLVKDMGVGSYKPVFILNIDYLIQVDTKLKDE